MLTIAMLAVANIAGLRVNATASMPRGLWRVVEWDASPRRGEICTVCPPDTQQVRQGAERGYIPAGSCPGGYEPLVKPVAATSGDIVTISLGVEVLVNDQVVPGTAQLAHDSAGRGLTPFPPGAYPVAPGQVWLLSGHDPRSFDSRYFGPVPAAIVRGVASPIWVTR